MNEPSAYSTEWVKGGPLVLEPLAEWVKKPSDLPSRAWHDATKWVKGGPLEYEPKPEPKEEKLSTAIERNYSRELDWAIGVVVVFLVVLFAGIVMINGKSIQKKVKSRRKAR